MEAISLAQRLEAASVEAAIDVHVKMIDFHSQELDRKKQRLKVLVEPKVLAKSRRVYVDGCYDLMHSGHYNALRQAKKIAGPDGVLVAGVHSCEAIAAAKGPAVFTDEERMLLVESCKYVDEVVFGTPYTTSLEVMDSPRVNCKYCAHGDDLAPMYLPIRDAGRMLVFKRTEGTSTTDLVGRLLMLSDVKVSELKGQRRNGGSSSPEFSAKGGITASTSLVAHYSEQRSKKMSCFLPTARRIAAFSNNSKPKPGDKIVYLDGVFDMFNASHVRCIKVAKSMGDFLYVGIHSDEQCRSEWGSSFPVMDLHERALCVLSNKYVDEVVLGAPWKVDDTTINVLKLDVVCDGGVVTKLPPSLTSKGSDAATHLTAVRNDIYQDAISRGIYASVHQVDMNAPIITMQSIVERIESSRAAFKRRQMKKVKAEDVYMEQQSEETGPDEV